MTLNEILSSFTTKFLAQITLKFAKKTDIPTSLPANGGDAATVNGHKVNADVPTNAIFTDTKAWESVTGKPSVFPPSAHTHGNTDITALDASKLTGTIAKERLPSVSASSVPWSGITGKPATFAPTAHTHVSSEITDFDECTDADIDAIISGAFKEV